MQAKIDAIENVVFHLFLSVVIRASNFKQVKCLFQNAEIVFRRNLFFDLTVGQDRVNFSRKI